MIKFSILIPTYKVTFLKECIESVLSQNYTNLELIIVDDASPENIQSVVSQFNDNRIRFYRNKKNIGKANLVANWNHCLALATGEYVMCIGDDDRLLPNCLTEALALIQANQDSDLYHLRKEVIDESGNIISLQEDRPDRESVYSLLWHLLEGRIQMLAEWLYRTDKLKQIGGFYELPLAWGADNLTAHIAAIEKGVVNGHIPVVQYRASQLSISSSSRTSDTVQKCQAMDLAFNYYQRFLKLLPVSDLDNLYHQLIKKSLKVAIEKKKHKMIENNIASFLPNIFYWFCKKNKMGIKSKKLFILFLYAIKSKILN